MAKKAKLTLHEAVGEICDRIDSVDAEYGEARTSFKWNGDTLFILRQVDLGNGYASADVYQLNLAAQQQLIYFVDNWCAQCDEDDEVLCTDDIWEHLESHTLVEFGD